MDDRARERYSRQILFAPLGDEGQSRLVSSTVAIAGCGALGTHSAEALARAGVGTLLLIDRDYVEWSNLQRQSLYDEEDAAEARPKAVAAARRLRRVNSSVRVIEKVADLDAANIDELFEGVQVVVDGTDNFETRYLINDWCVRNAIPWVYGGAVASYGITMPVLPGDGPCFRCVNPEPPPAGAPTCETAGVLGPVTAIVAALQAAAVLKLLTGGKPALRITTIDVWTGTVRQAPEPLRDPECPACVHHEFPWLDASRRVPISLCGRNAVQIHERARPLDLAGLALRLSPLGEVRSNEFALRFFAPPYEMTVFPDGRAIIKGTTDTALARSLYARYLGA